MVQGYQILYSVTTRILVGIWSALFYNFSDLIIANCCNIWIIETKFGAPGNRTPLKIKFLIYRANCILCNYIYYALLIIIKKDQENKFGKNFDSNFSKKYKNFNLFLVLKILLTLKLLKFLLKKSLTE